MKDSPFASLGKSIVDKPPYISGTFQLPPSSFSLFYKSKNDDAHTNATKSEAIWTSTASNSHKLANQLLFVRIRNTSWMRITERLAPWTQKFLHPARKASKRDIKVGLFKLDVYGIVLQTSLSE
ncbi:hypothetical protein B0F90DRAFT_1774624 [Multifurca ochricompacta]|uniref:Uncharacterized protein n=1 Tax=Multifurca ochricompacta TaxID=376703 RepID=A0AAD4QFE6_9AGAM|nr:hypothetical protein B0F90DRAFT_1774624 [Multifurca ochricompacta]